MYAVLGEIEFKVVTFWDGFKSTMAWITPHMPV